MTPPEVAVVIPTRDRPDLVRRAVACALGQEGVPVEVVVVDDGSAAPVDLRADGVRVLRHEASRGVAAARNAGVKAARADWVAFLDDDDLWAPGKLRAQLDAARRAGAAWVYASALVVSGAGRVVEVQDAPPPGDLAALLPRYNALPAGSSNVMARRDLLGRAGGFDAALQHLADWSLWARLVALAQPACRADLLVAYVRHDGSMHATDVAAARREFPVLSATLRAAVGRPLDPALVAEWLADGHALGGRHWRATATLGGAWLRSRSWRQARAGAREAAIALGVHRTRAVDLGPAPAWACPTR